MECALINVNYTQKPYGNNRTYIVANYANVTPIQFDIYDAVYISHFLSSPLFFQLLPVNMFSLHFPLCHSFVFVLHICLRYCHCVCCISSIQRCNRLGIIVTITLCFCSIALCSFRINLSRV